MKNPLRVAALQMKTSDDVEANQERIAKAIDQAADAGAQLLVTPECALSGYVPQQDLDFDRLEDARDVLVELAARSGLWLALGTTRRAEDGWYNTALLYSPAGQLKACYDKTHLMPCDKEVFEPGSHLDVFQAGEWTFGIQICFDMRFPENWRVLRRKGAEMVLHLSSASTWGGWKVPVLNGTMRCRAAENGMFIVSANDAREPQMMVSAILDPDGRDLARAGLHREELLVAEINREEVKDDFLRERRTDLWGTDEMRGLLLT